MEAADTLQPQGHPRLSGGSAWEDRRAGEARPTKRQAHPQDQMEQQTLALGPLRDSPPPWKS